MVTLVNSVGWAGGPAAVQSILAISPPIGQFSLVGQAHPANSQSSAALPARERDSRRGRYTRFPAPVVPVVSLPGHGIWVGGSGRIISLLNSERRGSLATD